MAYCGPKGIPLSRFLGWPQEDQDAALEWQAHEAARCTGCGTHTYEWNPSEGGSRQAYAARLVICPGCLAKERVSGGDEAKNAGPGARVELYRPGG